MLRELGMADLAVIPTLLQAEARGFRGPFLLGG